MLTHPGMGGMTSLSSCSINPSSLWPSHSPFHPPCSIYPSIIFCISIYPLTCHIHPSIHPSIHPISLPSSLSSLPSFLVLLSLLPPFHWTFVLWSTVYRNHILSLPVGLRLGLKKAWGLWAERRQKQKLRQSLGDGCECKGLGGNWAVGVELCLHWASWVID